MFKLLKFLKVIKKQYKFRPMWPSSGVKNIWWRKLLLFHASLRCARMSVTCVKNSVRIFVREASLYRVVTCLCTHCAWCVAPRYSPGENLY
jgi:hypothetical protein